LLFYVRGDRLRHLSPDVFVVKGVPNYPRDNYLLWEEGHPPSIVIELTSSSTKDEDIHDKYALYQDSIGVYEYFLFDPFGDYLKPPFRGYRLRQGKYVAIKSVKSRLPSKSLGLHLERDGRDLRLFDPTTQKRLLTPLERIAQVEADNERLRREVETLRRRPPNGRRG
jgi:Uma2 family endonuclease